MSELSQEIRAWLGWRLFSVHRKPALELMAFLAAVQRHTAAGCQQAVAKGHLDRLLSRDTPVDILGLHSERLAYSALHIRLADHSLAFQVQQDQQLRSSGAFQRPATSL